MNASPSKIKCGCGAVLAVTAAHAGKTVACPKCAAKIVVPGAAPTNWFVARGRERLGPFAPAQLKQLIASGQLKPDDMMLREGEKQWVKASAVGGLFPAPAPVAPLPPAAPPPQRLGLGARFRRLPWKVQLGVVGGALLALLLLGFLATRGGKKTDPEQQANRNGTPVKPARKSLDLAFIHTDASGAIVLHPRQALKAPLAQALPAAALDAMGSDFGVKTEQIEQVIFLVEPGSARPAPPVPEGAGPGNFPPEMIPTPGLVIRFSVPVANKALLGKLLVGQTETKKHKEREYLLGPVAEGMLGMATGGYTPDDRTVILAPEPMLLKMLDAGDAPSPLRQRLAQADGNDDLTLVCIVEPYRKAANFFAKLFQGMLPPPLDEAAKLPDKLSALGLAINLRTRTPLRLTIEADDEATAEAVEKLLQGGYHMAKATAPSWEPLVNSPMLPKPIQKELAGLVEQFLTKLDLERKGRSVEFVLSKPVAKAPPVAKAFKPLVPASGKKEVDLGAEVTDVAVGGAGRFLIYHLKSTNKLAVFDVSEGKVIKEIPTTNESAFFAAGARQLAVLTDDKRRLDLWNLDTLEKDKTAPLPASLVGAKIQQMCMGSASEGPIYFAMPLPEKRTEALDLAKMTLKPVHWQKFGPQNAWGPQHLRVAPDGRVLLGWGGGWAGLELARFQNGRQEEGFSGFRFSLGSFALPSPDGKLVFHPDSVVGPDLKDAKGPEGYLVPAREPGFFLALKGGAPPLGFAETRLPSVKQVAIYSDNRTQLLVVTDLAELAEGSVLPWEKTLHYYPRAGLVVTLGQKSKVVLRKLDLAERLEKDGVDYLFVFDEPARGKRGGELSHKLDIRSKKGGVTVKVVEAPEGLKVSADGQVSWTVPADFDGAEATVLLTIRDGSGQETQHQMRISVVDE